MEYWQLLKRPEWQKKRLEMLELAGWECQDCGSKENSLHVHHKQYFKGRDPWDYETDQLEVLCDECHNVEHLELQRIKEILSFYSVNEIYNLLIGYVEWDVLKRLSDSELYTREDAESQASGVIAKLLKFNHSTSYKRIAESLVDNAIPHLRDGAENFYRQNFPIWPEEL
jgi:hypothetical protein